MQTERGRESLRFSKILVRLSRCYSQEQGLVEGGCGASGLSPKRGLMNCYLASQLGEVRFRRGGKWVCTGGHIDVTSHSRQWKTWKTFVVITVHHITCFLHVSSLKVLGSKRFILYFCMFKSGV